MGLAAARTLAEDGARVVLVGRDRQRADAAAAQLDGAVAKVCDTTVEGEAERILADVVAQVGPIRGVAITTGLGPRGQVGLLESTPDDWQHTFDDVLMGTVLPARAAVPHLLEAGGGSIVTTAAQSVRSPGVRQFPYATLKAAVATFTKDLAKAFGGDGIRANCVCPGATETEVLASLRVAAAKDRGWPLDEALERLLIEEWDLSVALGRAGRPDELGDVIAFLLSGRSSYVTGALVNVDGGTDF